MKKIKYLLAISIFSLISLVPVELMAAVKVGVVDLQKARQDVNKGKKAIQALEGSFKARRSKIEKEQKEIEKLRDEFQKKSMVLSEQARNEKGMEIQKRIADWQQMVQQNQVEMQKEEVKAMQPILEELNDLIPALSKEKGVDLVIEQSAGLLYAAEKIDLTEDLIKSYNKKFK